MRDRRVDPDCSLELSRVADSCGVGGSKAIARNRNGVRPAVAAARAKVLLTTATADGACGDHEGAEADAETLSRRA